MAIGTPMNPGILRILATPIAPKTTCFFALPGPEANRHIPDAEKTLAWKIKEKWPADAHRLWVQLGEAPDGSLKNRIFATGTRIMDGIPEEEWFLKSVRYGNRAELVVPDFVNADQMIEQLKELCETRIPLHKRWRTLSVACLPLSAAAGILPGPNVFLLYNAFRVYSHHLALNHAIHLVDLLKNDAVRAVTSEQFSAAFTTWDRKSLIPDSIMDTIAAGIGEGGADYWSHVDRARKQFRKKSDQPS